jgi:hypothetical protein
MPIDVDSGVGLTTLMPPPVRPAMPGSGRPSRGPNAIEAWYPHDSIRALTTQRLVGRLVLAIEADGAWYHSSQTARDRDRLRQEQLQRLGWRFHRIWSQDWFSDRARQIEKALAAYEAALQDAESPTPNSRIGAGEVVSAATRRAPQRGPRPEVYRLGQIDEFTDADLQAIVRWIESDTLLRSRDDLLEETIADLGFRRRGKKIVARIGAAIDMVRGTTTSTGADGSLAV